MKIYIVVDDDAYSEKEKIYLMANIFTGTRVWTRKGNAVRSAKRSGGIVLEYDLSTIEPNIIT